MYLRKLMELIIPVQVQVLVITTFFVLTGCSNIQRKPINTLEVLQPGTKLSDVSGAFELEFGKSYKPLKTVNCTSQGGLKTVFGDKDGSAKDIKYYVDVKHANKAAELGNRLVISREGKPDKYGALLLCNLNRCTEKSNDMPGSMSYLINVPDEVLDLTTGDKTTIAYEAVVARNCTPEHVFPTWVLFISEKSFPPSKSSKTENTKSWGRLIGDKKDDSWVASGERIYGFTTSNLGKPQRKSMASYWSDQMDAYARIKGRSGLANSSDSTNSADSSTNSLLELQQQALTDMEIANEKTQQNNARIIQERNEAEEARIRNQQLANNKQSTDLSSSKSKPLHSGTQKQPSQRQQRPTAQQPENQQNRPTAQQVLDEYNGVKAQQQIDQQKQQGQHQLTNRITHRQTETSTMFNLGVWNRCSESVTYYMAVCKIDATGSRSERIYGPHIVGARSDDFSQRLWKDNTEYVHYGYAWCAGNTQCETPSCYFQ